MQVILLLIESFTQLSLNQNSLLFTVSYYNVTVFYIESCKTILKLSQMLLGLSIIRDE